MGKVSKLDYENPCQRYANKVNALFGGDKNVLVTYNNRKRKVVIDVKDESKATALACILVKERDFAPNCKVTVEVVYKGNVIVGEDYSNSVEMTFNAITAAFKGNPLFKTCEKVTHRKEKCVVCRFKKKVVQFPYDGSMLVKNFADAAGFGISTLAENLAAYVCVNANVVYTTEI